MSEKDELKQVGSELCERATPVCLVCHATPSVCVCVQMLYPEAQRLFVRIKWEWWALQALVVGHVIVIGATDPLDTDDLVVQVLLIR